MKITRFCLISTLIIVVVACIGLLVSGEKLQNLPASDDSLDMGQLQPGYQVKLQDSWEFHAQQLYDDLPSEPTRVESSSSENLPLLVKVPHSFKTSQLYSNPSFGYGTYRLNLVGLNPDVDYGIFIQEESTAYRLRVNGQVMIESGQVGRRASDYQPGLNPRWAIFRADPAGRAELAIELSNYDDPRGGFWSVPKIGRAHDILNAYGREQMVEMFLFTANLIMSLIFVALYAKSKQDRHILWLAIFTFLIGFRILLSGNKVISSFYPFLNWNQSIRLLYLIGFLLLPIFLWMLQAMHYSNPLKIIHLAAVLLSVVPAGLTILAPVEIFLGYYEIYRYLIVLAALYTIYVISQGIRSRKPGAEIIVLAFSFLVAGTLVEVFWGVDRNPYSVAFSTLAMIGLFLLVQIEKFHTINTIKENLETEIILDQLTGAFNRQYLEHHLEQIILEYERHAQPLSLILMDLDHFKRINDKFGHDMGDQVLAKTVATVKDVIRSTDPVIRWGGEEFLILARNSDLFGAGILAEKIRLALAETDFGPAENMTASFGVTERFFAEPTDIWFKRTDLALYQAKNSGRNQVAAWNPNDPLPIQLHRIEWQPGWDCCDVRINQEHRHLNVLANQLIDALSRGENETAIQRRLHEMMDHLANHFDHEEELLKEKGYPDLEQHAQKHLDLLTEASELLTNHREKRLDQKELVSAMIGKMVLGHLLITDSNFFSYLQRDQKRTSFKFALSKIQSLEP